MIISNLEKKDFEELFGLMQEAFPPEEYRPKEKQLSILDDKNYSVTIAKENEEIIAFIAVWKLDGFGFAEHLAVSSKMRGRGIGSIFLKEYLDRVNSPLVLEVENFSDETALRRIAFYERLGFVMTDICYDQPNFQNSSKIIPLRIMYHPNKINFDTKNVLKEIFEKVYKKNLPYTETTDE